MAVFSLRSLILFALLMVAHPAAATWGCFQAAEMGNEEPVLGWNRPPIQKEALKQKEGEQQWYQLSREEFQSAWHLQPQRRALLESGTYCSLLRGRELAQQGCGEQVAPEKATEALALFALVDDREQRLITEERFRCLIALNKEAEADSLLEEAMRLDSGTIWSMRRLQLLWERRAMQRLADAGGKEGALPLDSLRRDLLQRYGEKEGSVLDDSLRWNMVELLEKEERDLPVWAKSWMVQRLSKGSWERRKALWDWLEKTKSVPTLQSSVGEQLTAIRHLRARGRKAEAEKWLQKISLNGASAADRRAVRELRATVHFEAKRWADAAQLYAELVAERPQHDPNALLQLARSYRNRGSQKRADSLYALFRERYPTHSKTAEMHWSAATAAEGRKEWSVASQAYRRIDRRFTRERRRPWVEFRVALIDFKRQHYRAAAAAFQKAADETPQLWPHNGSLLLRAESLRRWAAEGGADRPSDSLLISAYLQTIDDHPVGWYAHRARQLLSLHQLLPDSSIPQLQILRSLSDNDIAAWLRSATNSALSPSAPLLSAAELRELDQLLLFGEWSLAEEWVRHQFRQSEQDPYLTFVAAELMMERGAIAEGYRLAQQLINRIDRRRLQAAPQRLMELIYPRPYWEWVQKVAADQNLDPYFLLALIRQESTFNDQIMSPVGAIGLGQIMPATGEVLAKQAGIQNYQTELLRNPLLSIALGGRYLGDLFKEWKDPRWVLANYNAGPVPTRRWARELSSLDWETAAEEVSYWETRDYIKRVMGNWWSYRQVWGAE